MTEQMVSEICRTVVDCIIYISTRDGTAIPIETLGDRDVDQRDN